jgi:hypothetical protein
LEEFENRLFTAFRSIAESDQKRMTTIEADQAAVRSRLATIGDRLLNVEKRLNIPPAA